MHPDYEARAPPMTSRADEQRHEPIV